METKGFFIDTIVEIGDTTVKFAVISGDLRDIEELDDLFNGLSKRIGLDGIQSLINNAVDETGNEVTLSIINRDIDNEKTEPEIEINSNFLFPLMNSTERTWEESR